MTESIDKQSSSPQLSKSTIWIYGSVSLPLAILGYPIAVWVPRLYSTEMGLSLAVIGGVIFFAAIFDAISDPLMGFFSDRTKTRWGKRRPWMVVGVPIYAVAIWMLLNPSVGVTVVYLAMFFILMRASTTIFGLPYAAWGIELSAEYHTRTLIQSVREKYVMVGLMAASLIVLLSEELWNDRSAGFVLSNFSIVVLTLLPITAFLVVWKVPEPVEAARKVDPSTQKNWRSVKSEIGQSLAMMYKNKLFSRLLVIELLIAGGENFRNTLSLFFIQDYIGADSVGRLYICLLYTSPSPRDS